MKSQIKVTSYDIYGKKLISLAKCGEKLIFSYFSAKISSELSTAKVPCSFGVTVLLYTRRTPGFAREPVKG